MNQKPSRLFFIFVISILNIFPTNARMLIGFQNHQFCYSFNGVKHVYQIKTFKENNVVEGSSSLVFDDQNKEGEEIGLTGTQTKKKGVREIAIEYINGPELLKNDIKFAKNPRIKITANKKGVEQMQMYHLVKSKKTGKWNSKLFTYTACK